MDKNSYSGEKETMENESPKNENGKDIEQSENIEGVEAQNDTKDVIIDELRSELEETSELCEEYFNRLQRTAAEFDNFKRRTVKEKELLYSEAVSDVISAFLPAVDSIDRAIEVCAGENWGSSVREGVELVKRQITEVMSNLGVEEIKCLGESFNPELHNAVMHVEDDQYGQNVVIEEFQKGYRFKDKVVRYSMVKVAN